MYTPIAMSGRPTSASTAAARRHLRLDFGSDTGSLAGRGEQPAADLDARGFGFRRGYQPRGEITLDLGQLVLVDGDLAALIFGVLALCACATAERPEHGEYRRDRHQREHEP